MLQPGVFYGLHNRITPADFILEATINSRGNKNLVALGATAVLSAPPVHFSLVTSGLLEEAVLDTAQSVRKCLSSASCIYSKRKLRKVLPPEGRP